MSDEKLALAITELMLKCGIVPIPAEHEELPFDNTSSGLNQKFIDNRASEIVAIYRSVLKAVSKTQE